MSPLQSILLACNRTFSTQTHWAKSVTLQWICSYPGVDSDAKRCPKTARELQFLCQQFWLVPLEKGVRYTRSFHIFSKYLWACCLRVKTFPLSTLGIQKLEWRTQLDIQTCLSCTLKAAAEVISPQYEDVIYVSALLPCTSAQAVPCFALMQTVICIKVSVLILLTDLPVYF